MGSQKVGHDQATFTLIKFITRISLPLQTIGSEIARPTSDLHQQFSILAEELLKVSPLLGLRHPGASDVCQGRHMLLYIQVLVVETDDCHHLPPKSLGCFLPGP